MSMIEHILDELQDLSLQELNTVIEAATSIRNTKEEANIRYR